MQKTHFLSSFLVLFLLLSTPITQAAVEGYSLMGSSWSKSHPGVLPYEECHLTSQKGHDTFKVSSIHLLLLSLQEVYGQDSAPRFIECTASSLLLSYRIPIQFLASTVNWGLILTPSVGGQSIIGKIALHQLDGKTVDQVLGTYGGARVGGGVLFAGGAGVFLSNAHQAQLRTQEFEMGDLLSVSHVSYTLKLRGVVGVDECLNPYVLLSHPDRPRVGSDCLPPVAPDSTPSLTPWSIFAEAEVLGGLVFRRITEVKGGAPSVQEAVPQSGPPTTDTAPEGGTFESH